MCGVSHHAPKHAKHNSTLGNSLSRHLGRGKTWYLRHASAEQAPPLGDLRRLHLPDDTLVYYIIENEFSGRIKGIEIAIADAAESEDHLISPEDVVGVRWHGNR